MSIQAWHTLVRLEYQKCNFPTQVDDRLQRDIFIIVLNETFEKFRSDFISRENLSTLTFSQVISKARDLEGGINMEFAIINHQLEEMVHKIASYVNETSHRSNQHQPHAQPGLLPPSTCQWCGKATHSAGQDCPAANAICGKSYSGSSHHSADYYVPLLGLYWDSTRMRILNYEVDTTQQLEATSGPTLPPLVELTLNSVGLVYPHLFEGLGELGDPYSLTLDPTVRPIEAAPHHYATPKPATRSQSLNFQSLRRH